MKNLKYTVVFILLFLINGSCKKSFFDLERPVEAPWQSLQEFEKAPIGAYAFLLVPGGWSGLVSQTRLLKDAGSDIAYLIPNTAANIPFKEMYNRLSTSVIDNTKTPFNLGYKVIAICNGGLDFIDEHGGNPFQNITQSDIDNNLRRIEGELHFVRAFSYYQLMNVFAAPYEPGGDNSHQYIPFTIHISKDANNLVNTPFGSTEEIYQQMISDFTKAKQLLPEGYIAGVHNPAYQYGRANKYAAASMLAKVYFAMGKTQEALAELDFVIGSGKYDLSEEPLAAFQHNDVNCGKETIWYGFGGDPNSLYFFEELTSMTLEMPYGNDGHYQRCSWNQFAWSYSVLKQIGWMTDPQNGDYSLTAEALKDKRVGQTYTYIQGQDPVFSSATTSNLWCDKYFHGDANKGIKGDQLNVPLIRLAELYLTRSYILFKKGDIGGATADLNAVRNRAGIGDLNHTITQDDILNERIKELGFEGDRTDFLRAAHLTIPPGNRTGVAPAPFNSPDFIWALDPREKGN
ncbi:MAG TPA: RagB/SusD family nutrient uptake outer membrane protein [Chitinophagaceae bacterium]|nr:RagB/SusD family nutrient uptake outer membrane protein [Chitinophagaceae bacterium]